MNKRLFVMLLIALFVLLAGWIYYISVKTRQSVPVEKINIDWWGSAHADSTSRSFTNWNDDDPPWVPPICAKCHSGEGFIDYIGQDGSPEFSVDEPAAVESVITCAVCHSEKADALEKVIFPSGMEIHLNLGDALCATCHSGMSAGSRVNAIAEGFSDDEVIPDASAVTPHYAFAAATWLGNEAQGGFQYPAKTYLGRFTHASGVETCTQCHDPHALRMRVEYSGKNVNICGACHSNVTGYADYRDIFVDGVDYDADGMVEGLYHEIQSVQAMLFDAIQLYAREKIGTPVGWSDSYPYLFKDTDGDGLIGEEEAAYPNRYTEFTPRLMRAVFNFHFSVKAPAGYVHNGKYILQLLYDSLEDLSGVVNVSLDGLVRP